MYQIFYIRHYFRLVNAKLCYFFEIHNMKQTALCMTSCLLLLFLATHFYLLLLLLNILCIKYSMYESF